MSKLEPHVLPSPIYVLPCHGSIDIPIVILNMLKRYFITVHVKQAWEGSIHIVFLPFSVPFRIIPVIRIMKTWAWIDCGISHEVLFLHQFLSWMKLSARLGHSSSATQFHKTPWLLDYLAECIRKGWTYFTHDGMQYACAQWNATAIAPNGVDVLILAKCAKFRMH